MVGTGSDDSTCQLFDIRCLSCINKFKSEKTFCGITSVAASKSGRILFSGMDDFNCYCAWGKVSHQTRVILYVGWDVLKDGMTSLPQWMFDGHNSRVMYSTRDPLCCMPFSRRCLVLTSRPRGSVYVQDHGILY